MHQRSAPSDPFNQSRNSSDPISREPSCELCNQNCETRAGCINDEVLKPGMTRRQRNLAQFQEQRKNECAQQQGSQLPGIREAEYESGESERSEMFRVMLKPSDWATAGRNKCDEDKAADQEPAYHFKKIGHHQIPYSSLTLLINPIAPHCCK